MTTRPARAAEEVLAFRVEYDEGAVCVEPQSFSDQLLARTARLRRAEGDEPSTTFGLGIVVDQATFAGRLVVREAGGTETTREVAGASCEEVIAAMALIAAVLVDPNASTEATPAPAVPPSQGEFPAAEVAAPTTPAPAQPAAPVQPAAPAPPLARRPAPPPPAPPANREETPQQPPSDRSWTAGAGAAVAFEAAVAPAVVVALALELTLGFEGSSILSPFVALAATRSFPTRSNTPSGTARFQWTAFRINACPLRWQRDAWTLRPCAGLELGELRASGERTERRQVASAPWNAVDALLRTEFAPLDHLVLAAGLGLVVPLRTASFYFEPDSPENTVFTVPAVALSGWLGISGRL